MASDAGVAHDDPRRRRVPPEEAEARSDEADRDESEVERRVQVVDREVTELPVADDRQHAEAERRRARGEAVESVGQVDRVGGGDDDEDRQQRSIRPTSGSSPGSEKRVNERSVDVCTQSIESTANAAAIAS